MASTLLRENQNGFREEKNTLAQILALRRLIEEVKNNLTAVLCIVDLKKTVYFDSIHRGAMMKILIGLQCPS